VQPTINQSRFWQCLEVSEMKNRTLKTQNFGFTIVELMVALLIGLLLLGGLIQIFVVTRSNYRVQQSLNYLQENLRFAGTELGYGVRMAGFFHTLSAPTSDLESADGATGTATGSNLTNDEDELQIIAGTPLTPGCNVVSWTVGLQGFEGGAVDPTSCIPASSYLPGTDVIAITYLRPVFMGLPALGSRPASRFTP
jgi:type IV pilus assembly protein PilW